MEPFDQEVYVFLERKDPKTARIWRIGNTLYLLGLLAVALALGFVLLQIIIWVFVPLALGIWVIGMAMKWWADRQAKKQGYIIEQ